MTTLFSETNVQDWESMAHQFRGGLRMLRASIDLTIEDAKDSGGYSASEWYDELKSVRAALDDLLKEVAGEK